MTDTFRVPVKIPTHLREWVKEEAARNMVNDAALVRILVLGVLEEEGIDRVLAENPRGGNDYSFSLSTTQEFVDMIGGPKSFRQIVRGALRLAYAKAQAQQRHLSLRIDFIEAAA